MKFPKKTHWTCDIKPELDGQEVTLCGWVWEIRDIGKIKFIVLRDREGFVQVTVKKGVADERSLDLVKKLKKEDVIAVRGVVRASKIAKAGVEVLAKEITLLNEVKMMPLDIWGSVESELGTRLRYRAADLKRPENLAIFKISSTVVRAIRETFYRHRFVEVFTPKIIATCTEGGADLFEVQYFERKAYLAQSPQLYKEQLTASLERVFEIGPAFRAEKHNTNYHLNEFISVDAEAAFMDYNDIMEIIDEIICNVYETVSKVNEEELKILKIELPKLRRPFKRITYDEAIEILNKRGLNVRYGEDIPHSGLEVLYEEICEPFYIIDWPTEIRPFYTMPREDDPRKSESFDLVMKGLEIASGSTRIHTREMLEKAIRERGLDPEAFKYHVEVYDWGMPPHAGFGLGLYRLLMVMLNRENIREVVLYPRDRFRLVP
ncbi:MAG: aspartate--tRNA(Asn) ligase [Crenarchaeota archaeon]|nr:aspartate--tRNA(Asn) ligase [Thermoproteota archaeon]